MKSLADLFEDTLKDIYFAEKQIVKAALPKMAKKASSEDLSDAFQHPFGRNDRARRTA